MISKPQETLKLILTKLFPGKTIYEEVILFGRLRFDLIIPRMRLAFEFDGEGHHEYIPFFHKNVYQFLRGQSRDFVKDQWCQEHKVVLIRINYEDLTEEKVWELVLNRRIEMTTYIAEELRREIPPFYPPVDDKKELEKAKAKAFRKAQYQRAKENKKRREK